MKKTLQVAVGNRELELVKWNDKLRKAVDDCIVHLSKKVGLALKKLLQDLHNYFLVSWDDSTCSGLSHCMLHKSVLQVPLKCTESDTTACLGQFLTLGAKASSWCGKHIVCFVESIDDSEVVQEEEHNSSCLEVIYMPVRDLNGIPGSQSLNICLTDYQKDGREDIMIGGPTKSRHCRVLQNLGCAQGVASSIGTMARDGSGRGGDSDRPCVHAFSSRRRPAGEGCRVEAAGTATGLEEKLARRRRPP